MKQDFLSLWEESWLFRVNLAITVVLLLIILFK